MHSPQDPEPDGTRPAKDCRASDFRGAEPPRDLLREVAASLRSLVKVLPYEDYALIVHRIARVRWQCEHIKSTRAASLAEELGTPATDLERGPVEDESIVRFWDAAVAYNTQLELAASTADLIARARRARHEAKGSRARVVADRERRSANVEARANLRDAIREYVIPLKGRGDSLDEVLRSTGTVLRTLRASGSVSDDMGAFEVDVQRIVAEEYCSAA
jgi:hypothetical protein